MTMLRFPLRVILLIFGLVVTTITAVTVLPRWGHPVGPSWIAFAARDARGSTIYRMAPDGQGQRPLVTHNAHNAPVWSPDGLWLYYFDDASHYRVQLANRRIETLSGEQAAYHTLAGSPDGQWVVFEELNADLIPAIYRVNADGSDLQELAQGSSPVWSPDGRWIAFAGPHPDGESHIYLMRADGSDLHDLVAGDHPVWSPDGTWIAFATGERLADYYVRMNNIVRVRPDGSDVQPLLPGSATVTPPAWSPPVNPPFRPVILLVIGAACLVIGIHDSRS
jgi:Tol biopolymer transport system component